MIFHCINNLNTYFTDCLSFDHLKKESAPSEEVNKLAEDRQKLLEELQTTKEENDRLQDELNKSLEELTNYKDIIEIHNVQQLSVS